jgi:hypothetical protein
LSLLSNRETVQVIFAEEEPSLLVHDVREEIL